MAQANGTTVAAIRRLLSEERKLIAETSGLDDAKEWERRMKQHTKRLQILWKRAEEIAEVDLPTLK